jgi:hypothetical protein
MVIWVSHSRDVSHSFRVWDSQRLERECGKDWKIISQLV